MRKEYVGLLLLLSAIVAGAQSSIPKVPATMEVAGLKLKITPEAQAEIQKDVNALRASDKYFQIKLDRVNLYFPIIERIFKEEGVPDDLKYLSVQESSLISDAVSTSDAVGFWQFKDFTAREVGLRVDGKVDERKNIVSSSRGAARYLKRNNMLFKNWIYAVSAYQAGPGGARQYVDEDMFGSDKLTIDKKTHWYVLRFLAHVVAFRGETGAPHSEGLHLVEFTKGEGKDLASIARQFDVDVAQLEEYNKWLKQKTVPDDKAYTVLIPMKGKAPKVKDEEHVDQPVVRNTPAKEPEPSVYPQDLTKGLKKTLFIRMNGLKAVMASANDNLVTLAVKSGISSTRLEKYNDMKPGQHVEAGAIYYIQKKKRSSPIRYHVTQEGETLWSISQRYGMRLDALASKNRMKTEDVPKPGRVLWLKSTRPASTPVEYHDLHKAVPRVEEPVVVKEEPKPFPPKTEPVQTETPNEIITVKEEPKAEPVIEEETQPIDSVAQPEIQEEPQLLEATPDTVVESEKEPMLQQDTTLVSESITREVPEAGVHIVQEGESLWAISRQYGLRVEEVREQNNLPVNVVLQPGQRLLVDARPDSVVAEPPVKEEQTAAPNANFHIVAQGESLWSISRLYSLRLDSLLQMNDLEPTATLSPGQRLRIRPESKVVKPEPEQVTEPVKEKPAAVGSGDIHTVQAGESMWSIARKYGATVEQLRAWNNLSSDNLALGQQLKVSAPPVSPYQTHIVKGGDTLYKVAQTYGMTVEELIQLNNLQSNSLSVGDELKVKR